MSTGKDEAIACRDVVELVTAYLDAAGLTPEQRITLEQHLLVCPPCTTHVDQMRTTIALSRTLRAKADASAALDVFRKWQGK